MDITQLFSLAQHVPQPLVSFLVIVLTVICFRLDRRLLVLSIQVGVLAERLEAVADALNPKAPAVPPVAASPLRRAGIVQG